MDVKKTWLAKQAASIADDTEAELNNIENTPATGRGSLLSQAREVARTFTAPNPPAPASTAPALTTPGSIQPAAPASVEKTVIDGSGTAIKLTRPTLVPTALAKILAAIPAPVKADVFKYLMTRVPIFARDAVRAAAIVADLADPVGMLAAEDVNKLIIPGLDGKLAMTTSVYERYLLRAITDLDLVKNALKRPALNAVHEADPTSLAALKEPGVRPLRTGNELTPIVDGPDFKQQLLEQIASAKKSIWINVFEWQNNGSGVDIVKAVIAAKAANANLDVKIVVDNRTTPSQVSLHKYAPATKTGEVVAMLKAAGCQVLQVDYAGERVNHRKIYIFDGKVSIVGGHNIGDNYLLPLSDNWPYHDASTLARGPIVADDAGAFADSWERAGGKRSALLLPDAAELTKPATYADRPLDPKYAATKVQTITHQGGLDRNIEREIIQRLDSENKEAIITNGYGLSREVAAAMIRAQKQGVHVVWLWGTVSDAATIIAEQSFAALKAANVDIRLYPHPLHMKAYYFADNGSQHNDTLLLGSANTDGWSGQPNDEHDRQYIGGGYAKDFYDQYLAHDLAESPQATTGLPLPNISDEEKFAAAVLGQIFDEE